MKLEFSQQIFKKYSNIKFRKYPSGGWQVVARGHVDERDKANSHFFAVVNVPKNEDIM
jgi:hypothetical protein